MIDKTKWPDGPWINEPDHEEWIDQATGLRCMINRNRHLGHLCGYVGVDDTHPLHGVLYSDDVEVPNRDEVELHPNISPITLLAAACGSTGNRVMLAAVLRCHGGVTFSGPWEKDDPIWWFGFDCGHAGDQSPAASKWPWPEADGVYRDWAYVKSEVESLAKQLKEWGA